METEQSSRSTARSTLPERQALRESSRSLGPPWNLTGRICDDVDILIDGNKRLEAQNAALLEALRVVVRDAPPSGHSHGCTEFRRSPFTTAQGCCGQRIARAIFAAAEAPS